MNYIKRTANSAQYPELVEYLQLGILIRFNITEIQTESELETGSQTSYAYDEFWFSLESTLLEIENICSEHQFTLTEDHKNLIK